MIRLQCECGRKINAPDQYLGKRVKCPQCGRPVLVRPAEATAAAQPTSVAAAQPVAPELAGAPNEERVTPRAEPHDEPAGEHQATHEEEDAIGSAAAAAHEAERMPAGAGSPDPEPSVIPPAPAEPSPPAPAATSTSPRPIAPAPTTAAAFEEEPDGPPPHRLPSIVGALALVIALGAAAVFWVPRAAAWTLPLAVVAVVIALLGLIISIRRFRLGIGLPVLALLVGCAAGSLPWTMPLLLPGTAPAGSLRHTTNDENRGEAAIEARRRGVLVVDSLKLVSPPSGATADIEYKLTNISGKPIKAVVGSVQIYDRERRALGGIGLNVSRPIAPKASVSGKDTWTLGEDARTSLDERKFTAEYRADRVLFADGSVVDFSR